MATLVNSFGILPMDFTVSSSAAHEKGAFMLLTDPRTVTTAVSGGVCAGIAAVEKVSTETEVVNLACHRFGVFTAAASGAILLGEPLQMAVGGALMAPPVHMSGAQIVGTSLETVANGDTFDFELNIGGGGVQIS